MWWFVGIALSIGSGLLMLSVLALMSVEPSVPIDPPSAPDNDADSVRKLIK